MERVSKLTFRNSVCPNNSEKVSQFWTPTYLSSVSLKPAEQGEPHTADHKLTLKNTNEFSAFLNLIVITRKISKIKGSEYKKKQLAIGLCGYFKNIPNDAEF